MRRSRRGESKGGRSRKTRKSRIMSKKRRKSQARRMEKMTVKRVRKKRKRKKGNQGKTLLRKIKSVMRMTLRVTPRAKSLVGVGAKVRSQRMKSRNQSKMLTQSRSQTIMMRGKCLRLPLHCKARREHSTR